MPKYRRISSNIDLKEKKKVRNGGDTKSLMDKLGFKMANDEKYTKKYSMNIKQKNLKDDSYYLEIYLNNENKKSTKTLKSKSQQKRNRNDNLNERKYISSSYEKRIIKKEKIKKIKDNKENKENKENKNNKTYMQIKSIKNNNKLFKERENSVKTKKIRENNDKNNNNENYTKKKMKSQKETKNASTTSINNSNKKITTKKEVKISQFKPNKDDDDIKRSCTIKIKKNTTNKEINKAYFKKYIMKPEISKINEEDEESPKKEKNKTIKDKKTNPKKEIKDNIKDIEKKNEKQKKFRKNKARSVDKIIKDKIFDFKTKKLVNNIEAKNKKDKSNSKSNSYTSESKSVTSENSSDSESGSNSDNNNKNTVQNKSALIRSNKRHSTEMASQKLPLNEEKNLKIEKNEKNEKKDDEKEIKRSNKRHLTEMSSQVPQNCNMKEEKKDEKDVARTEKKKLTVEPKINEGSEKKINKTYLRRRSMDNPILRQKLDSLMDNMLLKQNGGNSLFMKNYEKGPTFKKEIELLIKNQKVKKTIKISSCTKAGCSGPGIVKTNQDAYFIKENFLKNSNNFFLGVCDGHGEKGELVSRYVIAKLPEYIKDLNNDNITNNFKKINNEVFNSKSMDSNMSGTTVVSLVLTTEKIISINLGDSRASIFKYENGLYYCKNLTRDHKPSEPDEYKRIINNNGRIKKCYDEDLKKNLGPDRVWLKNKEEPGLAMTRSIGDKIAHSVGVSDEPEFKNFDYDGTEKFIIIASDGIWEYLHGDDCIKVVRPFYEEGKDSEEAALALVKEAFRKWRRKEVAIDDITSIVVFFED